MVSTTERASVPPALPPAPVHRVVEQPSWFEQHRGLVIGIGLALVVLLAAAVWAVVAMVNNPAQTETIRDIFIVFMALEALVIGVALVVLVVQVALLTNLLRHEVKPILDSTQETARTLRGTATFISQNLVDPVIKMQSSVAAVKSVLDLLRPNNRS
jgi:hypothetical protein